MFSRSCSTAWPTFLFNTLHRRQGPRSFDAMRASVFCGDSKVTSKYLLSSDGSAIGFGVPRVGQGTSVEDRPSLDWVHGLPGNE